jgi:uncharacterized phiE125 gp8 family phage protein
MAAQGLAVPLVSMSEAQAYVRIETGEEEALLAGLIRSASGLCEAFLGQVVIAREFATDVPASGKWERIDPGPVQSITGLEGVDATGASAALPASGYVIDIDCNGEGWVRVMEPGVSRVRVSGTVGMVQDENGVPEAIRQGVLRLVAHLFTARDGELGEPPAAVTALWRPYRRMRLA